MEFNFGTIHLKKTIHFKNGEVKSFAVTIPVLLLFFTIDFIKINR